MQKLLDEKQAAALLNVSVKTLQARRTKGGGPKFAKLGRSVRYAMSDLKSFVLAALRTSTSDRGRTPVYSPRPGITIRPTPEHERVLDRPPGTRHR
jgi:predicted DNA-binding transcriptional regulator AlpA